MPEDTRDSLQTVASGGISTFDSGRRGTPDLRLLHYNDVYHVEASSSDPCGGAPRFQTLVNHYRSDPSFSGQPSILTFFSGDAFNPSLESTITKGQHMVPFLNHVGTDVACVGNHDLDFGIAQFRHLRSQCKFPWLLANVLDPALGEGEPLANCQKTCMLVSSNGIKVGVIGLGEREWLATINYLPPNLIYKSASETAKELVPALREQGADIVIAVTHQREPNDNKLAEKIPPGLVDIILGGHDHYYSHSFINSTHVLRSGTDFKQLSYIEAWRKQSGSGWDFNITRRDITRDLPKHLETVKLVDKLTSALKGKLHKPIGYTVTPLDGRFTTVRTQESNLGNFVCDVMRCYHNADCAIMAAGTIRGDQIYPPGILRVKDLLNCFPFEDPVVVLRITGKALRLALENGVSELPALEGRFPQVSNIKFAFSMSKPPGSRILWVKVNNEDLRDDGLYTVSTRGYMARGKDGFASLLTRSEGGKAEEVVSEEDGLLLSTMLRQYFLSNKILGKWNRLSPSLDRHWMDVHKKLKSEELTPPASSSTSPPTNILPETSFRYISQPGANQGANPVMTAAPVHQQPGAATLSRIGVDTPLDSDSDSHSESLFRPRNYVTSHALSPDDADHRELVARRVLRKWRKKLGVDPNRVKTVDQGGKDHLPPWTRAIAPVVDGRIIHMN
ncbi:Nucleotidase of the calcineurin superfamily [Trichophyton interdigitale]|uniref:Nucleotidase of the calcineurin superfamily n=1 Tax=Trichophyton interdigitale TaxID=101480 RepID=A0A9P4YEX0_9EURO|nr:Nucleotidase of the calcineurin superfamily [Trichophyton interdigitale]KAF3892296.1 Nucleotidase of the calcineurin superfamily [Trichophyton interdigitale]KAG8208450.1 Nucleotidase of the calcineurin superfamily [Trichophyton interdigitale]